MAAKLISISDDDVTYQTLPGATGDFSNEASNIDDTIFGQTFQSSEVGVIGWGINANAYFKGFPGYQATMKQIGTPTATTGESMTVTTGNTYQIDDITKRVWDRAVSATTVFYDTAVDDNANVASVDPLNGTVTFATSPSGAVTCDVTYLPLATFGKASNFTLTQTAEAIETSDFPTVQGNGGFRTFLPGLRTVQLELSGFNDTASDWPSILQARAENIIEINPSATATDSFVRGYFKAVNQGLSGDVGALEEESVTLGLTVPLTFALAGVTAVSVDTPFSWTHGAASAIPEAIKIALTAWETEALAYGKYLHDGTNGWKGSVVVTDVTMSSGMDAMAEFAVNMQGSGATTAQP